MTIKSAFLNTAESTVVITTVGDDGQPAKLCYKIREFDNSAITNAFLNAVEHLVELAE